MNLQIVLPSLLVLFLTSCSTVPVDEAPSKGRLTQVTHPTQKPAPGHEHPLAKDVRDYQEIELAFSQGQYDQTLAKILQFNQRHPKSELLPSVENLHGLLYLQLKKPAEAAEHFKRSIQLNPNNQKFNQYILYNLASAQFDANSWDEAGSTLDRIDTSHLDSSNHIKALFLRANIFDKKERPLDAARVILSTQRDFPNLGTNENKAAFNKLLEDSITKIKDPIALTKLAHEFPNSTILQGSAITNQLRASSIADGKAIGVLLPMKGKFSKFGQKALQGIELAFGIFGNVQTNPKAQLIIEDSGDDVDQAKQALDRLVLKHRVIAVIGPMLSKGLEQVAQRAQELGVPLLSLSRKNLPFNENTDFVFQAGLTQQMQASSIAEYAIKKQGLKRFVILYPDEKQGLETAWNFWDAVDALGGKIAGIEAYHPGETDFRQTIDKVAGLYYTTSRQREWDELVKEREANRITKRTHKTDQYFRLKPLVDFDAVFIPDEPKAAGQIFPTFAYRDIEKVSFLGISAWNSPEFISRAQAYGESSIFVDAYLPTSENPHVKYFSDKYKSAFGQIPSGIEALAFDSANLLHTVLASGRFEIDRFELRDRLKQVRDFQGVTGRISYRDGQLARNFPIISVKNGQFVEAP